MSVEDAKAYVKKMKKARGVGGVEHNVTTRLFHQIVSIDGEEDRSKIQRMIQNMPAGDSRKLRTYIDDISPGIEMKEFVACPSCGESSEVDMPLGAEFFWPGL